MNTYTPRRKTACDYKHSNASHAKKIRWGLERLEVQLLLICRYFEDNRCLTSGADSHVDADIESHHQIGYAFY